MDEIEFHHVAYATKDMAASMGVWQKKTGARVELPPTLISADDVEVCFLIVGGTRIELVQPRDSDRAVHRVRDAKGRPDHTCFLCNNLDERVTCARDEGGVVVRPPVFSEAFGKRMSFVLYPAFGLIEWVEK